MEPQKPLPEPRQPEGCLVTAVRIPVRIVVLVLVVPVRMVWDAFVVGWRFLYGTVVRPVGRGLVWLGYVLVVAPVVWGYRYVLTPLGHAFAWVFRGIGVVVVPALWVCRWVLTRVLFVLPALALWRWVCVPVGREIRDAFGPAWRVAGRISLAVGRFLGNLFRWIFVEPVRWVYRSVLTPVGHVVRDAVLRPCAEAARSVGRATRQALASARESARQARADLRRMVFGEPRKREAVDRREPRGAETRTLDSSTTALTKD